MVKLFCVDPSLNLQNCMDKAKSTIFFSATLLPIQYYKKLLSTKEDNYAIYAESSFSQEQSLILIGNDVSTKYTRRTENEFRRIAEYLLRMCGCKKGNYMAFFPSYRFMEQVLEIFTTIDSENTEISVQANGMTEIQREEFLMDFQRERERSFLAFCVMGGIFGEGIDLKADQLIGVAVIGTGLPQISNEREILKKYYDTEDRKGFDYAFRYPGINKVLQAAGRVIRTQEDRGIILLLDDRFLQVEYQGLYPREWNHRQICNLEIVERKMSDFWDN